ncbi:MAG: NAD(P)/FAD-dependent oxidoreductase [Comamonadaceae bacterium]|nr:MAG: NAD(P)/FAD-dependent oxidoreductase [Comamonadaceae bacterium]
MSDSLPIETDALVIGAGPVGLFQAFQLGLLEIPCHIVDALPHAGGQCIELYADKPIYDIPGLPRSTGRALVAALTDQLAPFRPNFHLSQQVMSLAREADGRWLLGTSTGIRFLARSVIVAAGVGAFVPRRLPLAGIERFEGDQLAYHPATLDRWGGRRVTVVGGDDAALEAAIALAEATTQPSGETPAPAGVTLLHRRDVFQAEDTTILRMRALCADGALQLRIGQVGEFVVDDADRLRALRIGTPEGGSIELPTDAVLAYLGISPRLGPIADWGLALERKQVPVDTEAFRTSEPGIFAVGDINTYPGKKKLILCGFHEATLAAWGVAALLRPEQRPVLQYTTTSTRLHELLGVSDKA